MANVTYDDFISNIQPDPANPTPTIMLSGFVGHGAEGHVRIYPDPTLGSWYDVPEGDIVHTAPVPDSKLGGSYVWVRASAEIKPGSAAAAAAPAGPAPDAAAPAAAAAAAAAPAAAAAAHPAAVAWPTPATHCFVCWPPTSPLAGCGQAAAAQPAAMQPTPATHCFVCWPPTSPPAGCAQAAAVHPTPPLTLAAICGPTPATLCFICPPITHNCTPPAVCAPTPATHCFICPPITHNCTPATVCTLPHAGCPPHTIPPVCPLGGQPQAAAAAFAPPQGQQPAAMQPTPATRCFICPPHITAQIDCTFGCPPHTIPAACPLPFTPATICTLPLAGCPLPTLTQPVFCGILPPSVGCPQGGQPQAAAAAAAQPAAMQPTPTAATHCFICPPITIPPGCGPGLTPATICTHPLGGCLPPHTPATICTHPLGGCLPPHTQLVVCGTPPVSIACQQGAQPQAAAAAVQPTLGCTGAEHTCDWRCHTQAPGCTVHVCLQAAAQPTPSAVHQCGPHPTPPLTLATVCTQPLGCTFVGCTPQCPGVGHTLATLCTHPGFCPTQWFVCPPGRTGVFTPFGG